MSVLEQVQDDVKVAMKARDRERAGALRLIVDVLQQDAKLGKGDEIAVLQRERKKRVEAAEAYEGAGRAEQAAAERFEAELIEGYLPQQLSEQELAELVDAAIAEAGATGMKQMGQVMSALKSQVAGRAASGSARRCGRSWAPDLGAPAADAREHRRRRAGGLRGHGAAGAAGAARVRPAPARQRPHPGRRLRRRPAGGDRGRRAGRAD